MNNLTPKQDGFCQSYIETGNASEAYRLHYSVDKMKDATVNNTAYKLLNKGEIRARIETLQLVSRTRHSITIDSLTTELNEAFKVAKEDIKPSAMVAAVMGKAKLHGLLTDKVEMKDIVPVINLTLNAK